MKRLALLIFGPFLMAVLSGCSIPASSDPYGKCLEWETNDDPLFPFPICTRFEHQPEEWLPTGSGGYCFGDCIPPMSNDAPQPLFHPAL